MKITKHKTSKPGVYSVKADGRKTNLYITKGEAPDWGMPQMWDCSEGIDDAFIATVPDDGWLFEARSKKGVIAMLERIYAALTTPKEV